MLEIDVNRFVVDVVVVVGVVFHETFKVQKRTILLGRVMDKSVFTFEWALHV